MNGSTTRRDALRLGAAGLAGAVIGGRPGRAAEAPPKAPGGHCVAAMSAATETVDPHFSHSSAARNVLMHMCETLVTIDERASPQLQLAERLDTSKDFRTFTFTLRKGVPFHNGKEMTAQDAKRSLERYARISPEKARLADIDRLSTPDRYTLVAELKSSKPSWIELLKSPASPMSIIPAELCDGEPNKVGPVSTGPFRFTNWDGATEISMARFKDYQPNTAYPGRDGYGGRRTAWFDEGTFKVIKEASARVAGLQTGQFHLIDQVPAPAAKRLEGDKSYTVYERLKSSTPSIVVNVSAPPTDNLALRRAMQAILNIDEIMSVAAAGLYRLNPCWIYPDNQYYPKDAASLVYNIHDPARAKALLKQAGYKGEEIVMLTTADYTYMRDVAVVSSEQMKAIGLNVKLNVMDWPGMNARGHQPKGWNMYTTAFAIQPLLGPFEFHKFFTGPGNYSFAPPDKVIEDAFARLAAAKTVEERSAAWWTVESRVNEQVIELKIGDLGIRQASSAKLRNFTPFDALRLWDDWLT
jgi:peptide/nickel transport system substrate-binding protein